MSLPLSQIQQLAKEIKMIALDVDGVMTDGIIFTNPDGSESKGFHVRDGFGIIMAKRAGIKFCLITGRLSDTVKHRAEQLEIDEVHGGFTDKAAILSDVLTRHGLKWTEVAYMGDDLFDLPVMRKVQLSATPSDGCAEAIAEAKWVSSNRGGHGAIRELIELILKAQGLWETITSKFIDN